MDKAFNTTNLLTWKHTNSGAQSTNKKQWDGYFYLGAYFLIKTPSERCKIIFLNDYKKACTYKTHGKFFNHD